MMLQRQAEVSGILRERVTNEAQLQQVFSTMQRLSVFFTKLSRVATKLQLPLEIVFQCLLQINMGGLSFDQQHRDGSVPMHQAKVLDRESALAAAAVEPRLRGLLTGEEVNALVDSSSVLRRLLRMKVEDGNDLSMARRSVVMAEEYLGVVHMAAEGDATRMWRIYAAETEQDVRRLTSSSSQDPQSAALGDGAGELDDNRSEPLPAKEQLVRAISEQVGQFSSTLQPVPDRLRGLATVAHWLQELDQDSWNEVFPAVFATLHQSVKVQLGEKRSAVCRAACHVVSSMMLKCTTPHFGYSDCRDATASWLDVVLKQVHVTVAAIADATDAVARDVSIAAAGAPFVATVLSSNCNKATQPELQRKLLGFCSLTLVATDPAVGIRVGPFIPLAQTFSASGSENVRRVARCLGLVIRMCAPDAAVQWDDKVEKLASAESATVAACVSKGLASFESGVLRYATACRLSLRTGFHAGTPSPVASSTGSSSLLTSSQRSACASSTQPRTRASVLLGDGPLAATHHPVAPPHTLVPSRAAVPLSMRPVDINSHATGATRGGHFGGPAPLASPPTLCASLRRRVSNPQVGSHNATI